MSEELKPCPMCNAEIAQNDDGMYWHPNGACILAGIEFLDVAAWNQRAKPHLDVDQLANIIRAVDGDNTMGAGELAEAIVTSLEGYDHVED